jgi:hypothetical protein
MESPLVGSSRYTFKAALPHIAFEGIVFGKVEIGRQENFAKVFLFVDLEGFATGQPPNNNIGVTLARFL